VNVDIWEVIGDDFEYISDWKDDWFVSVIGLTIAAICMVSRTSFGQIQGSCSKMRQGHFHITPDVLFTYILVSLIQCCMTSEVVT